MSIPMGLNRCAGGPAASDTIRGPFLQSLMSNRKPSISRPFAPQNPLAEIFLEEIVISLLHLKIVWAI